MAQKIKFNKTVNPGFYSVVQQRVNEYFTSKGLSSHANTFMIFKVIFCLGGLVAFYLLIMFGNFPPWVMLIMAGIAGLFSAMIGINVSHDAIHGALSGNPLVNKIIGFSFNMVGANSYMWSIMHNIVHHTYTNIPDADENIESVPILRLHASNPIWKIHRFQHIYAFPLYMLASFTWVFFKDFVKFFQREIGNYDNKTHKTQEYFILFSTKALYYTLFVAVPLLVLPFSVGQIILGFAVFHAFGGFTLAIIFMLAHIVEDVKFPSPNEQGEIDNPWAAHQMYTTANFARKNPVAGFICGGLNFQIEHHLFPRVCHIHYPAISSIVEKTAKEYNLPYYDNPTFFGALRSHARLLYKLGHVA